jgi:hypothetical protein
VTKGKKIERAKRAKAPKRVVAQFENLISTALQCGDLKYQMF